MAVVILDSFTDTASTALESHTPDTGTAWTLVAGAAGACFISATNALRGATTTASHYVASPDPGSADTYISFRLKSLSTLFPNNYVCLRLVDNNNWIGWRLAGTGSLGRRLSKRVAGTITDLISGQGVDQEWIKVEASGNTIKLFEGGTGATPTWTQVGADQTVTDHNTETSVGFQIASSGSVDWIDDYEAGTLSGGAIILTPGLLTNSQTFYAPTVTAGAVTLTPSLYSNAQTFYAPTVTPGSVTLTPSLFSNAQTFYSPSVVMEGGPQTLTPPLVANTSTFYAATVTTGAVTITPALFANSNTFFAPEVSQGFAGQTLTPSLVVNTQQFFTAIVTTGGVTLTPSLFDNVSTFYAHLVTGGEVVTATLSAPRRTYSNTQTASRSNTQTARRPRA